MAIAYDTQHQLDHLFSSGGLDLAVRNAIINYLKDEGLGSNSRVWVQEGNAGELNPRTQVLYLDGSNEHVHTDANLKAIVDVGDAQLEVSGSNDILVAAGQGVNLINLSGTTGNDEVVIGGRSADKDLRWDDDRHYSTLAGAGDDRWYGGDRNDGNFGRNESDFGRNDGGFGRNDGDFGRNDDNFGRNEGDFGRNDYGFGRNESDFGGNDSSFGRNDNDFGRNEGDQGHGNGEPWGEESHYSSLSGGDGGGRDGDNWNSGGGNDGTVTITAGSGNDTIVGGKENDLIELGRKGNDVIYGGGGNNTVQFDDSLANATISSKDGVTTVKFSDTHQTITLTDVQTLEFTDHHGKV